jgi:hypothetical protein
VLHDLTLFLNWWLLWALAWKIFLQTIFDQSTNSLSELPSLWRFSPRFLAFYFSSEVEVFFSSSSSKACLWDYVQVHLFEKVHWSNVLAMFLSSVNAFSKRSWNLVVWNPWLQQNVGSLRCRPELCVSGKSWVHISLRLASVFASDLFLPSVMDKCTGVSTAWLLIAVLGVLCNVSVPGVLAENPPGLYQSTANLLACPG